MEFSHAYLFEPGDARLVYNVAGGQSERSVPAARQAPANALPDSDEWDADTLTLTCLLDDGTTHTITLTEAEIEAAKATDSL